jgi:hypothetical protein
VTPGERNGGGIYPVLTQLGPSLPVVIQTLREEAMTSLEQALASILELIEKARVAGNTLVLATLMQRKDTICAALAAPEQH